MAYELIYTSAPEGLRQGSTGFCVVACTRGIGTRLVMTLESLSAYKPLYPHYADNAWDNPVSRAHCISTVNGEVQHILSRVCFNGVDHTGRSNKLASHLVLSTQEAANAVGGPGAVLLHEELFKDAAWEIKAQFFERQLQIPATEAFPARCNTWEAVTGDAGWGGFLAQSYLDNPSRNVYIAYREDQHTRIMMLIQEAINLLPENKRWDVTFNTYFVNLPVGMSCTWRCCPVDSPVLHSARRSPANIVIDITSPQELTAAGELIDAARTGILPQRESAAAEEIESFGVRQKIVIKKPVIRKDNEKDEKENSVPEEKESCHSRKVMILVSVLAALLLLAGGVVLLLLLANSRNTDSVANEEKETVAVAKTAVKPGKNQKTPVKNQETPVKNQETPVKNQETSEKNQKTAEKNQKTSEKNQKTAEKNQETAEKNQKTPVKNQETAEKNQEKSETVKVKEKAVEVAAQPTAVLDERFSWQYDIRENQSVTIPIGDIPVDKIQISFDQKNIKPGEKFSVMDAATGNTTDIETSVKDGNLILKRGKTRIKTRVSIIIDGKTYPLFFKFGTSWIIVSEVKEQDGKIIAKIQVPSNSNIDAKNLTAKNPEINLTAKKLNETTWEIALQHPEIAKHQNEINELQKAMKEVVKITLEDVYKSCKAKKLSESKKLTAKEENEYIKTYEHLKSILHDEELKTSALNNIKENFSEQSFVELEKIIKEALKKTPGNKKFLEWQNNYKKVKSFVQKVADNTEIHGEMTRKQCRERIKKLKDSITGKMMIFETIELKYKDKGIVGKIERTQNNGK